MGTLRRFASRLWAVLQTDTDVFFDRFDERRRRRFREHPVAMHITYLGTYGGILAALWMLIGWKSAVETVVAGVLISVGMFALMVIQQRRGR